MNVFEDWLEHCTSCCSCKIISVGYLLLTGMHPKKVCARTCGSTSVDLFARAKGLICTLLRITALIVLDGRRRQNVACCCTDVLTQWLASRADTLQMLTQSSAPVIRIRAISLIVDLAASAPSIAAAVQSSGGPNLSGPSFRHMYYNLNWTSLDSVRSFVKAPTSQIRGGRKV